MARRIEIPGAMGPACDSGEACARGGGRRPQADVIRDLRIDGAAPPLAAERGIKAMQSAVVDGRHLGCCNNVAPDCDELQAAGVSQRLG